MPIAYALSVGARKGKVLTRCKHHHKDLLLAAVVAVAVRRLFRRCQWETLPHTRSVERIV